MAVEAGTLGVAVVGCGLIGRRRAAVAAEHPHSTLRAVVDTDGARARSLASETGAADFTDWRDAVESPGVDVVVVATPNAFLLPIAEAALAAGRHVLLEKPMGRTLEEARRLAAAAERSGRVLKVGFNHRYHPAVSELLRRVREGEVGRPIHILARYGHGGRPGLEAEWRGDPELAGGGHLLDQGVHVADLLNGLAGEPDDAVAFLRTSVWPIRPLEDNAYAMYRWAEGPVAQVHVSMTQWKNRFSLEVYGEQGSLAVEGLGGSYGPERLTVTRRRLEGGVPDVEERVFEGPDDSWRLEWEDFMAAVAGEQPLRHGTPSDGVAAMRMIDALYRSAAEDRTVPLR